MCWIKKCKYCVRIKNQISVWYKIILFQLKKANIAVMEMRGRNLAGCRLQTDYASHECRAAFFDHCKKSGMDVRERAKPWEQEQSGSSERR